MALTFAPARPTDHAALVAFLTTFSLAIDDLPAGLPGFTLVFDADRLIGSAGLERVGAYGLLRSFAVHPDYRNRAIGERLYAAALAEATAARLPEVWLITTQADRYFEKYGFERVERDQTPADIRNIPQFTGLCPASAVVMRKALQAPAR